MTDHIRFIWQLSVLSSLVIIIGILLIPRSGLDIPISHYLITVLFVTLINLAAWLIMAMGIRKMDREGIVFLLGGIGMKFLLYLVYLLAFWLVTKFISKPFIITFFALYLVFTFLLAGHLFKLLKNN
jgi:hypothetical protein